MAPMTELETRLQAPDGQSHLDTLLESLKTLEDRLNQQMSSPLLDRSAFQRVSVLAAATASARNVLMAARPTAR